MISQRTHMIANISNRTHIIVAFVTCLLIAITQNLTAETILQNGDAEYYIGSAIDLKEKNIFTDSFYRPEALATGPNGEGMFMGPLYPAVLSIFMHADRKFYDNSKCFITAPNPKKQCSQEHHSYRAFTTLALAISYLMIWAIALTLAHRKYTVAWGAILLCILCTPYTQPFFSVRTETLLIPLYSLASFFALIGHQRSRKSYWLLSGIFLGLATLTRPSMLYIFYLGILFLVAKYALEFFKLRTSFDKKMLLLPACFILGFAACTAPWVVRNEVIFNEPLISKGYAPNIFSQRVAFNDMRVDEWLASFIIYQPSLGRNLENKLPLRSYERLIRRSKNSFYKVGNYSLRPEYKKRFPGQDYFPALVKEQFLPNIPKHIMVTLSLTWRGIWVGNNWNNLIIPLFLAFSAFALTRPWTLYWIAAAPPILMTGFHGFVSVGVPRYNLILIPVASFAAAYVIYCFALFTIKRFFIRL